MAANVPRLLVKAGLGLFRLLPHRLRLHLVRFGTPNYTVGALLLIRRGNEFLLVRQRHSGSWALPGGLLAGGEDAETAVHREITEEIGSAFGSADFGLPVGVLVDPHPQRVDVLYAFDVPDTTDAPPGNSAEVLETGWFGMSGLPSLTPVTPAILAHYRRVGALAG